MSASKFPHSLRGEGQDADARTDIWAFGCVVYEMVTGQEAFEGANQASSIRAIMSSEPATLCSIDGLALARATRGFLGYDGGIPTT